MTSTTTKTPGQPQRDALAHHYGRIGISAVASVTHFLAQNRDQAALKAEALPHAKAPSIAVA